MSVVWVESQTVFLVASAVMFTVGGVVKGTLGVGLPLVVVPLLCLILPTAQKLRFYEGKALFGKVTLPCFLD